MDQQGGGRNYIGGSGETYLEMQHRFLNEKMRKIQRALDKVKMKRLVMRSMRMKREFPIISVVGYTNAGKDTRGREEGSGSYRALAQEVISSYLSSRSS